MNMWQKLKVGWAILFGKPSIPAIEDFKSEHVPEYYLAPFKRPEFRKNLDALSPAQRELWFISGQPPLPSPTSPHYVPFWSRLYQHCATDAATQEQKDWYQRQKAELVGKEAAEEYAKALFGGHMFIPKFLEDEEVKVDVQPLTEHIPFIPTNIGLEINPDLETLEVVKLRTQDPELPATIVKDKFIPLLGLLVVKRLQEERTEVRADWVDYEMVSERIKRDYPDDLGTLKWVPELTTQLNITREPDDKEVIVQTRKTHIVFGPSISHVKIGDSLANAIEDINKLSDDEYKVLEELRLNKLRLNNLKEM